MKTEFDRRCDRLEKQIANAGRDLMSRNDEPFINRSGKKVLGPFEAEISELRSMASTKVQKRRLKKAEDLLADLRSHWFGKAL